MTPLDSLRELGPGEEAPAAAKERVYGALLLSVQAAAAAAAVAKVGELASHAGGETAGGALLGAASAKLAALGLGVLLLGGVAGAGLYGALRPPRVEIIYVDRPVPVRAPPLAPPSAAPTPTEISSKAASTAVPSRPTVATSTEASELARERALLDQARKSAAQGDAAAALETAELHRARFPSGKLAEEREALAIRALSVLGRSAEASERAQAFRGAYPNSFFAGIVDPAASTP